MRPPVPDAGRRGALRGLGAGCALLAGCGVALRDVAPGAGEAPPAQPGNFLLPAATVSGGFTLAPGPVTGDRQPSPGPFLPLISPVAAAARGSDLYLADAGHNAVFHYDLQRQMLRRFLSLGGQPGIRLCVMGDHTLLVLDPFRRSLMRLTREGVELSRLQGGGLPSGALDLAVDEATGTVWVNDATGGRLVAIRASLNAPVSVPLPMQAGEAVAQVTALARGPDALYVLDASRRRVLRLDEGGRTQQAFGELDLQLPRALAVDRYRRVYVAEAQGMKVFFNGRLVAALSARELGATEIRDLRIHEDDLAIADAPGARVRLYRVRPPEVRG